MKTLNDFDRFAPVIKQYLPQENKSYAAQLVTATYTLIFSWFHNDHQSIYYIDVVGNHSCDQAVANAANWLFWHTSKRVNCYITGLTYDYDAKDTYRYSEDLFTLAEEILNTDKLRECEQYPPLNNVFKCAGPFGAAILV